MDEARQLLILARELTAAPNIASMYRRLNSAYFDNQLPHISVTWARSKVWAGLCAGTWNRRTREGTVKSIKISTYVQDADEDVIEKIMLHEMVHALSFVSGKYDGHGVWFDILRREYSNKSGVDIPRYEKLENFKVPETLKTRPVGVVVYHGGGRDGFMTYNWNAFRADFDKIIEKLEWAAEKKHFDVTLLKVEDRDLMVYPEKRRFKLEWFPGKADIRQKLFEKGKELARVTSGHQTLRLAPV